MSLSCTRADADSWYRRSTASITRTMSESAERDSPFTPAISWPLERLEKRENGRPPMPPPTVASSIDPAYLPGGKKALCSVSFTAFSLGLACGLASVATMELAFFGCYVWRAPFFIVVLAVFHYLEYDATARYNPVDAKISSFLLSANGSAYDIAHTAALTELLLRSWLISSYKPNWLTMPFSVPAMLPSVPPAVSLGVGFALIVVGQSFRTSAMAEAGKSFNHIVQSKKRDDHTLVTGGIYSISRHPSYFGFFWWALGTQIVLGNYVCFPAYAVVLWHFFASRIASESHFKICIPPADAIWQRRSNSSSSSSAKTM